EKPALLDHQAARVGTEPARVPAEGSAAGHAGEDLDGAPDVRALDLLLDELVVDPPPAVAHDLVAGLDDGRRRLGIPLERPGHGKHAHLDAALGEQAHETPEARAAPVLVHRLDLEVAHAAEDRHADDLLEERLGLAVAVQDRALPTLLVVHDDLEREPGAARPFGI